MAYCAPQDIRMLIPIIDVNTMSDADMGKFIVKAESFINARLGDTYIVPFNPAPSLIKDLTAEYAGYLVLRTVFGNNSPNSSELVGALKQSAEDTLKQLAEGKMVIDAPKISGLESTTEKEEKVFSLEDITPFRRW